MAEARRPLTAVLVTACLLAGLLLALAVMLLYRAESLPGMVSLMSSQARTPRELLTFLESKTAHVKGVRVNGHHLEIGKRPSLQIVAGYDRVMYQMRPRRQVHLRYRNFTGAEVMDFCSSITGRAFESLRSDVDAGRGPAPAWKGKVDGRDVALVRAGRFSYLVTGLADRALFMGQVELGKRLGMNDATVLHVLIPAQDRWLHAFRSGPSFETAYPLPPAGQEKDELVAWLGVPAG